MGDRQRLVCAALGLLSILAFSCSVTRDSSHPPLSIKMIYQVEVEKGTNVAFDLDSTWNRLLLIGPQKITIHRGWQGIGSEEVREITFDNLPCHYGGSAEITGWSWVPNTSYALLGYCLSLWAVDLETMRPVKRILAGDARVFRSLAHSSVSGVTAILSNLPDGEDFRIEIFDHKSWTRIAAWEANDVYFLAGFTPDEDLVATFERGAGIITETCGMIMYEVPSGKQLSRWEVVARDEPCPLVPKRIPRSEHLAVSAELGDRSLKIWDVKTGRVTQRIQHDGYVYPPFDVSPNGRWLAARVANDPRETFVNQDFKIWDLATGQVVYESAKYLQLWHPLLGVPPHGIIFSVDGKYLLVHKYSKIQIYKLAAKSGS